MQVNRGRPAEGVRYVFDYSAKHIIDENYRIQCVLIPSIIYHSRHSKCNG